MATPTKVQTLRSSTPGARPSGRLPGELYTNWADKQLGVVDASNVAQDLIAVRFFSTLANYAIGAYAVQAGNLYRAKAAVTPGAFNPAQWDLLATKSYVDGGAFLPIAGGTLTGNLAITTTAPGLALNKAASGQGSAVAGQTNGLTRWLAYFGDNAGESGSNAGSNFAIWRYTDAGAFIDAPLTINRATGALTTGPVDITGVFTSGANQDYALAIDGPAGKGAFVRLNASAAAAQGAGVTGHKNGFERWALYLGDGSTESGSNAGSNFFIQRFSDAGSPIDIPFQINRATGNADFSAQLTSNGGAIVSKAPNTSANPIFFTTAGDSQTVARMYTLGVGHAAIWDNALVSTNLQLDAAGNFQYAGGSGAAYKAGGGPWTSNSDARIKDVLGDYAPGLDEVLKLRPVRYAYKGNDTPTAERSRVDPATNKIEAKAGKAAPYPASSHYAVAKSAKEFVGLIAQEAEAVMPDMVTKRRGFIDGEEVADFRDLDTSELIFALVNAVKTLSARVQQLEAQPKGAR